MKYDIITLFPEAFSSYFEASILKRAREAKQIDMRLHNLRDWTIDKWKKVDDTPYGGGAGMVLMVEPLHKAVTDLQAEAPGLKTRVVLFSAKGKRYTQEHARRLAGYDRLILICGRYEGVDERVAEHVADEELSIGDFVLTGGELAAMVVVDSTARLLPGVLGNAESPIGESHTKQNIIEHPQYTKPEEYNGWKVPEVLLSGHHENIEEWRKAKSEEASKKLHSQE